MSTIRLARSEVDCSEVRCVIVEVLCGWTHRVGSRAPLLLVAMGAIAFVKVH